MVSPTTPASPPATPSPTNRPPSKWTPSSGKIPSQSRTASTTQPHPRTPPPHPSWRHLPPSLVEQATSPSVMVLPHPSPVEQATAELLAK
ncbi:hypothetical protein ACQJBY_043112 [Aegilops geniculata]